MKEKLINIKINIKIMSKTDVNDKINFVDRADIDLLRKLSEIRGSSGHEDAVRTIIRKKIERYCDKIETDTMGNLFGIKFGEDKEKSILLSAHMDEIGFIIKYIDKEGFIRVAPVGGQNYRLLPGLRVVFDGEKGEVPGIFGEKAIHIIAQKDRMNVTPMDKTFIDVGLSNKEEVEKYLSIGDYGEFDQQMQIFPNSNIVNGKAFDDRAGCYVLIRVLEELDKIAKPKQTIIFCFSTQEEIGTRGAIIAAYKTNPQSSIVIEVTHGLDYPGINKAETGEISLGKGPSISVGPNLHPKISKKLINIAKENKIPFQIEAENRPTGTDARSIQITRSGVPVGLVSIPIRYMHTVIETMDLSDLESTVELIKNYVKGKTSSDFNLK